MTALAVLLLLVLAGTCVGSLVPGDWLPSWLPNDKALHAAAYGTLTVLALTEFGLASQAGLVLLLVFAIGLLLECVQHRVPGRSFSIGDVVANAAGITGGATLHVVSSWV